MSGPSAAGDSPTDPAAARLVASLVGAAGEGQVRGVLLFGSRLAGTDPTPASAYDLVVVVRDYRTFHERLRDAGFLTRPPGLMAAVGRILPPNVTAFEGEEGALAKCLILDEAHFERGLSAQARDHFLQGRLVQRVALVHAADEAAAAWIGDRLAEARGGILRWAGPFFEEPFTASDAARTMLKVSYGGEIRPESGDRAEAVYLAQRPHLDALLQDVLDDAEARGDVVRVEGGYRFSTPRGERERRRVRRYFLRSKARATARWFKHVVTFDNWLDYIARKVERRTGMVVEITPWERRLPYLLLWPKVIRVLRSRPSRLPPPAAGEGE